MPNNSEVINWSLSNETNPLGMTGLGVKNLNGSSKSTQYDMTDQTPMFNPYENVFYKDLDLDTTKAYTISITMDNLKTVHNDYSKNLNLFTFGQHLAGENCGVFTVGTDTTTNSLKPVIGTLGKKPADTKKALPIVNAVDLAAVSNTDQVKFTLTYNPVEKGDDRLMLFVNDVKQCTGEGLGIDHHNFVVTRPRLYFLYSGWTNEVGWENKFDYSAQRVVNVKIDRVALYPASYYASKFQSVALEFSSSVPDFNVASFANSAQVQVIMTNSQDIGVKTLEIVSGASTFVLSSSSIAVDGKETFVGTVTDGFPSGFLSTNTVRLLIDGNALPNVLTLPTSSKYFVDHDAPSLNVNGKSTKGITFDKQEGQEVHLTFEYVQDNTIQHDVQITGNEINATTMLTANTSDSLVNNNPIRLDIVAVRADNYQDSQTVNDYVTNFLASVDPTTVPKTSAIIKSTGLYDLTGGSLINELKISDFLEVDRYYTGYYFIIAKATDKAGNVSEYMQVEVPITNKVSVVDQFSPEIAIYELTESPENNIPGITLKGHAYDEASYFDVYAVAVLSSQANTFALDATLKDFLVNNAVQTRVLNDQAASTGALASNLGFLNTDTRLTKYWNGAQFANIQLDNQYTAFAMCIEDSGKFNYNLDKYDGFVSIDQSVASFGVNPAQSSLADVQTTTVDGTTTHIVKPGAVLDLVWTMNYSGSQDTDFEASFNSVPMSVLAIDQFTFKASFTVDQNTSGDADGKLVFALKYLPKQAVSVHAENVCLEALEVTNDFNVVPEINGSDYEHTTLKVDNIITAIPKSALKNMGVFYGFAFDVELSVGVTNGVPTVHTFDNVSYDANATSSYNGFSKDISFYKFTGLLEATDYNLTLTLRSNGLSASFTKTQNTGVDAPKVSLVNNDIVLSSAGEMSITVSGAVATDTSGTATLYAFLVDGAADVSTLDDTTFLADRIDTIDGVKRVEGSALVLDTYFAVEGGSNLVSQGGLNPTNADYKVVYFAKDDKNNSTVTPVATPSFAAFSIENVTMVSSNSTTSTFLKRNDTLTISWDTTFASRAENFSMFLFNIPVLVNRVTDTRWTATMAVPSYFTSNGHVKDFLSVNYLGQAADSFFAEASENMYVDVTTPTLSFGVVNTRPNLYHKRIQFKDVQLDSALEKNFLKSTAGTFENYEFKFNAKHKGTNVLSQLVVDSPTVSDYDNLKYKSIEDLEVATAYEVWMEAKDPAGNHHITPVTDFTTYHTEVVDLYVNTKTKSASGIPEYTITGHAFDDVSTLDVFAFVTKTEALSEAAIMQACMDISTNKRSDVLLATNSVARNAIEGAWSKQFTEAYKADGSVEPIVTDTSYVVHVVSRLVNNGVLTTDLNNLTVFTTELPSFTQSVVSSTFLSNLSDQSLAKENAVVSATFETLYKEEDASRFNMEYVFEANTPNDVELEIAATNGSNTQWLAAYTVESSTPNGSLRFILNILADHVVDLVTSSPVVAVQKNLDLNPVPITNFGTTTFSVGSEGSSVVDTLFADKTSYTYNNVFNLTMVVSSANDPSFVTNTTNLLNKRNTDVAKKFTFENLKEGATYKVDFTIEDLVLGFTSQSLNNTVTLSKDLPLISSVVVAQKNVNGNLTIEASAKYLDSSSTFDAYVAVFDAHPPVDFDYARFYQTLSEGVQVATDSPAGAVFDMVDRPLTTYYNPNTLVEKAMTTSVTTYYVNYFVADNAVSPANIAVFTKDISLNVDNYLVNSSIQITNNTVPGSAYAKEGDSLTLSWVTNYSSTQETFFAKLFTAQGEVVTAAVDVPVQGVDDKHWSITKPVPAAYNGYVAFSIVVNGITFAQINPANNVYADTTKPNITNLAMANVTSRSVGLKELAFDDVDSRSFDRNGYTLTLSCVNVRADGVTVPTTQQSFVLDENYAQKVFTASGLQSGDTYTITATITDLVGNVSDVYNVRRTTAPEEFEFKLVDEEKPIIDATMTVGYVQNGFKLSDISAYDRHHAFDVYGVLYRVDPSHTFDEMEFMMYVKANKAMDGVELLEGLTHSNLAEATANLQELVWKQAVVYAGDPSTSENLVNGTTYKYCVFAVDTGANKNTSSCVSGTQLYNDVSYYEPLGTVEILGTIPMETKINPETGSYDVWSETGVIGNTYNVDITKSDVDSTTTYVMNDTTSTNTDVSGGVTGSVINFPTESPLQGLSDWSWVTSVSASNITSDIVLLYSDATHYVKIKPNGDVEMQWGGSTPIVTTNTFADGVNDLAVVVNGSSGELSIQLNGVTTTVDQQTITPQTSGQLYLSNSGNETVTINRDIEFVARPITELEITAVATTRGRVLEYNFDALANDAFANELLLDLPLVVTGGTNAGDIVLETEYPREGAGACKFATNALSLVVDLTKEDFFVDSGVAQSNMTAAFYYFHPAGTTDNHLMTFVFDTKKLALKVSPTALTLTDEGGAEASVSFDAALADDQWFYLAFMGSDAGVTFYLDSVKVGDTQTSITLSDTKMTSIVMGRGRTEDDKVTAGTRLDKFRLYDTVITQAKLASIALDPLEVGMLLRFDFEITDASKVYDESTNTNDATIYNATAVADSTSPISQTHLTLDGVDGYLDVTYNATMEATNLARSTFACWVNNKDVANTHSLEPLVFKTDAYQFGVDYEGSADKTKGVPYISFYDSVAGAFLEPGSLVPVEAPVKAPEADRDVGYVKDTNEIGVANLEAAGPSDTPFIYVESGVQPKPIHLGTATTHYVDAAAFTGLNATDASEYSVSTWFKISN